MPGCGLAEVLSVRVCFAGSAAFSLPTLHAVARSEHPLVGVLTAPDRPGSRGAAAPRPVKVAALATGLPVGQPVRLTEEVWRELSSPWKPEVLLVAAYGQLIPSAVLGALPRGGLGVHPSLLPRHRGASPVAAAILAGDPRTGVTVFRMEQDMDAGPILAQRALPMPPTATTPELTSRLAQVGAELAVQVLDDLEAGDSSAFAQLASGATYTHRLSRRDGRLDWSSSAAEVDRSLRALGPWPGVTVPLDGVRVKLLRGSPAPEAEGREGEILRQGTDWVLVGTAQGAFRLELIQPPGREAMTPSAFLRGRQQASGRGRNG